MNILWWLVTSSKRELKLALGVLTVLFLLPLLAVVVIANAGVSEVAHALVSLNPITHLVQIHNANGQTVDQMELSTVWPVNGVVTLGFGANDLPYELFHTGIDIANPHHQIGDPVTPFAAGTVILAGWNDGYGNCVMVDHGHNVVSLYGHLSKITTQVGDGVKPGDVIGLEGMTGDATGPHVHFEIRVFGVPVDPRLFMVGNPESGD